MTTPKSTQLRLAVCLFPGVTALDFIGPIDALSILGDKLLAMYQPMFSKPPAYTIDATYLSHDLEPVTPSGFGPRITVNQTYRQATDQFDIILVPGGIESRCDPSMFEFIKNQEPGAKYILTVCGGSALLAQTGILDGKKATTHKMTFTKIKAESSPSITWVPKARWVVDGKIWSSSGVTAGLDMTNAFMIHLVGEEIATIMRAGIELRFTGQDDDEFAVIHGLV